MTVQARELGEDIQWLQWSEQNRVDPQRERIFGCAEYLKESTERIAPTAEPNSARSFELEGMYPKPYRRFDWPEYLKELTNRNCAGR